MKKLTTVAILATAVVCGAAPASADPVPPTPSINVAEVQQARNCYLLGLTTAPRCASLTERIDAALAALPTTLATGKTEAPIRTTK